MQNYFNRTDREQHIIMMVFQITTTEWLEKNKSLNKEERRYIKTALTWLKKGYNSMIVRSTPEYIRSLKNTAKHCDLLLEDNTGRDLATKCIDTKTIDVDDFYDLADYAVAECTRCSGLNHETCKRYQLFMKLGIPPAVEETDGCPYYLPLK